MEEVDKIILNSLTECGCDFAENVKSVCELTTENVVEAAVRCLRIINPELKMSHALPPGMSARFRVGTTLAQACQTAGYRGDIGYQTFLYSSETEIRRLLMFLVEKLPRRKDENLEQTSGKTSVLERNIAKVVKNQLANLWLPPYCKKHGIRWMGNEFSLEGAKGFHSFITEPLTIPECVGDRTNPVPKGVLEFYRNRLPFVHKQVSCHDNLTPSLLERNSADLYLNPEQERDLASKRIRAEDQKQKLEKVMMKYGKGTATNNVKKNSRNNLNTTVGGIATDSSFAEVIRAVSQQVTTAKDLPDKNSLSPSDDNPQIKRNNITANRKPVRQKPALPKKPDLSVIVNHKKENSTVTPASEPATEETEEEKIKSEVKDLKTDFVRAIEQMESIEMEVKRFQDEIIEAKEELQSCEESSKKVEEKVKLQEKTIGLLPNAEENIAKLKAMVETYENRMVNLTQQWDKHRVPLVEKYENLKRDTATKEIKSERKLKELKLVRERLKESTEEIKRKEQLEKQLTGEYGDLVKDVSRQAYTKKIFEIVANIRKQKEEIERALADMRALQKEINQLQGRVERTFMAADDAIFQDAKRDDCVRQAYKYLVALQTNCTQLLNTVEDTGGVMREIRDLEEQIATESQKNTAENLKKILADYKVMKKENIEMMKELKSSPSPSNRRKKKS